MYFVFQRFICFSSWIEKHHVSWNLIFSMFLCCCCQYPQFQNNSCGSGPRCTIFMLLSLLSIHAAFVLYPGERCINNSVRLSQKSLLDVLIELLVKMRSVRLAFRNWGIRIEKPQQRFCRFVFKVIRLDRLVLRKTQKYEIQRPMLTFANEPETRKVFVYLLQNSITCIFRAVLWTTRLPCFKIHELVVMPPWNPKYNASVKSPLHALQNAFQPTLFCAHSRRSHMLSYTVRTPSPYTPNKAFFKWTPIVTAARKKERGVHFFFEAGDCCPWAPTRLMSC